MDMEGTTSFLTQFLLLILKVMLSVAVVIVVVLRCVKKGGKEHYILWGGFQQNMSLVLSTYVDDIGHGIFSL